MIFQSSKFYNLCYHYKVFLHNSKGDNMQKIVVILCLLSVFLFANELDINRIKQGDFAELKAYLTQLESVSKQRDLNYNEYKTFTDRKSVV